MTIDASKTVLAERQRIAALPLAELNPAESMARLVRKLGAA